MKPDRLLRMLGCVVVVASVTWMAPAIAEKIDCSGTKTSKDAPYRESIKPGDRPEHELVLAIRNHAISSIHPDFDGSIQTAYAMHDEYGAGGAQSGYFLYTLTSGEKVWARFNSVDAIKKLTGSKDTWEATYQGSFRFIGGTGKYAAIRGGGTYQGTVRPTTGFQETFACEAEY